jgi:hypothetical protein
MSDLLGDDRPGRATIRDFTVQLLLDGVPMVDGNVFAARDWPTSAAIMPCLLVYMWQERKTLISTAGGQPDYSVAGDLAVHARAEAQYAAQVEALLDLLAGAIETALLNCPEWMAQFERVPTVTSTIKVTQNGSDRPVGEAVIIFSLEWTERFPLFIPDVLESVHFRTVATDPAGASIGADVTLPTV